MRDRRRGLLRLLALGLALAPVACGKRGDPRPPIRHTPLPVSDIRASQRGKTIEISLVVPRVATDGAKLPIVEVELRVCLGPGDFDKTARMTRIRAAPGERLVRTERLPPPGTAVRVVARVRSKGRLSTASPEAALTAGLSPEAPVDLALKSVPKGVALVWSVSSPSQPAPPGASEPAGQSSPPSFNVYRRSQSGDFGQPLTEEPVTTKAFWDNNTSPGDRLCYTVRAVASTLPLIESDAADEACLTVVDLEAPAPPQAVAARDTPDGLEISWRRSPEPDLASYRIYRYRQGGALERIGEIAHPATSYVDKDAPKGVAFRYAVTAVDAAGNESGRSEPTAPTTHP